MKEMASVPIVAVNPERWQKPVVISHARKQKEERMIPPTLSLISGGIAGGVEASITYPFEFAKTRTQLQATRQTNPIAILSHVARHDGIRAIYTGCSTLILGTTFKAATRFLCYDSIRNVLMDDEGRLSPARGILAGMIAGAVESIVAVTPTERIKTALIDDAKSNPRKYTSGTHALTCMIRERGFGELYRGLASATLKQSATSAVRMGSYNVIKEWTKEKNLEQNSAVTLASGAVAGIITVVATQPFDSMKTMAQSARGASTVQAFQMILSERGVRGFWSGSTMRLGRLVFSGAIVFTIYEKVLSILAPIPKI